MSIINPFRKFVHCGYCEKYIFQDQEVNGRLFVKNGKPICVLCRVKLGKKWKQIDAEVNRYIIKDQEMKEEVIQAAADQKVIELAIESQEATGTGIKK